MARTPKWTIASARQHLPAVIASAAREPQRLYRRNKLVAAVVRPELADSTPSLVAELARLRDICEDEDYTLPAAARRDRPNPVTRTRRARKRR